MELWRWVQASPIVHLVSRRIPTSLPGFPNGLILHDAAITRSRLRGRSEDVIFAEDPRLIQKARRGLSSSALKMAIYIYNLAPFCVSPAYLSKRVGKRRELAAKVL